MKRLETDRGQYDSPADVFWATGACLMVRSSVYEGLGGLDERFFAHMEEIDLCWRMQLAGYKVTVVPESMVWHVGGGTLPSSSPFKLFLNYRNNLLMLENNLGKTMALKLVKDGMDCRRAAVRGLRKAGRRIFARKCLDGLSAMVYLMTLEWKSFCAVYRAHKEYRKLAVKLSAGSVESYLQQYGDIAEVTGIHDRWIVLDSMLYGDKVFETTRRHL